MFRVLPLVIFMLVIAHRLIAQDQLWLEGVIFDEESGMPIAGVSIKSGNQQTLSDEKGFFRIFLQHSSSSIEFSHLSYQSLTLTKAQNPTEKRFYLKPTLVEMKEIKVSASKDKKSVIRSVPSLQSIDQQQLLKSTGFMGQKDALKAIATMPGMTNSGEGNSGLFVRGGSSGENLTLLNDATIYNPSHLLGLFSVFNSAVVDEIDLYKAGVPAEYSGRLSSLIRVTTDKSVKDSLQLVADVSPFSLNLSTEIPIQKNWSIGLYGRKTFFNQTVWPLMEKLGSSSFFKKINYDFYDLNLISNAKIGEKTNFQVSLFRGGDDFNFRLHNFDIKNSLSWTNTVASATSTSLLSNRLILSNAVSFSGYQFNFGLTQENYQAGIESKISDMSLKTYLTYYTGKHQLKFGFNYINHRFKPNTPFSKSMDTEVDYGISNTYYADEFGFFMDEELDLRPDLKLRAGIRLNNFRHRGPYTQVGEHESTLFYPKGTTVKNQYFVKPSLSLNYLLNASSSLKASVSHNVQAVHMVSVTAVNFPTDFWMPSLSNLQPAKAWQGSLGYFKDFDENAYNFYIDFYYKKMDHLLEFSGGIINLLDNLKIEDNLLKGKGNSYGAEFFVRKNQGKFTGQLAYTLSYSNRRFPDINEGKTFPFKYDRRHDLNLTGHYQFSLKWSFSGAFALATGHAFTMPVSRYLLAGNVVNEYGTFNGSRMQIFHRLDFAASRTLKETKRFSSTLSFSIYNVYSRQNPIYTFFLADGDIETQKISIKPKSIALLPILPAINYRIQFK